MHQHYACYDSAHSINTFHDPTNLAGTQLNIIIYPKPRLDTAFASQLFLLERLILIKITHGSSILSRQCITNELFKKQTMRILHFTLYRESYQVRKPDSAQMRWFSTCFHYFG